MDNNSSKRNLFLISASSIFFWLGLSMIQGFSVRLMRDVLTYIGSNNVLTYFIGLIIEISIIVFGLSYLFKQLKTEEISNEKLFKTSITILVVGYLLNFANAFLYIIFDMNIYNAKITKYLEFYSSMYVSIIQFIAEIFPLIFIGYLVMKSKSQPQS